MEEELKVSKDLLKSITVETRANILKALGNRQMTASELSRYLSKHVTTVTEHLDQLQDLNLVERIERPGRKWVYYRLTKTSQNILSPKPFYKLVLTLVVSFITLAVGIFILPLQISSLQTYPATISAPTNSPALGEKESPINNTIQSTLVPNQTEIQQQNPTTSIQVPNFALRMTFSTILILFSIFFLVISLIFVKRNQLFKFS